MIDQLVNRRVRVDTRCQTCGMEGEPVNHVLFVCTAARQMWVLSNVPSPNQGYDSESIFSNLHFILDLKRRKLVHQESLKRIHWIMWMLWKNRNVLFFEGKFLMLMKPSRRLEKTRRYGLCHMGLKEIMELFEALNKRRS